MKNIRLLTIGLLLLAGLLGTGWFIYKKVQNSAEIKASGTIQSTEIQLSSRVGGRIQKVLVQEGAFVEPDDLIVSLDPYQLPAKMTELKAQLKSEQAKLQDLINGPRSQEVSQARSRYKSAQAQANLQDSGAREEDIAQAEAVLKQIEVNLENDRANYERFKQLHLRQVVSNQEFEKERAQYQNTQQKWNESKQRLLELQRGNRPQEIIIARENAQAELAQLNLLKAGTRPELIKQQEGYVQAISARIEQLRTQLQETKVTAPCYCQVSVLDWKAGQLISPNQAIASLININDLWIRVYIPSERFGQMKIGDVVQLAVDAFPNETFSGKVIQLASKAEFTPRNIQTEEGRKILVFGVKVAINNSKHRLRPGMPADVIFTVNEQKRTK